MYLDSNQLSGPIPSSLGDLANLVYLDLSDNQLSSSIPSSLGGLAHLEQLGLGDNQLSGSIPASLGDLASLQYLVLNNNQLSGSIPASLCRFKDWINPQQGGVNLSGCAGDNDEDRAALVEFYNATNGPNWATNTNWSSGAPLDQWYGVVTDGQGRVVSLSLTQNQLSGSIPSSLGRLANLEILDLWGNELSGAIPSFLGSLANLQELSLGDNELSGSIPSFLGSLTNLRELWLRGNQLSGSIPSSLGGLANLRYLSLDHNELSGSIPAALGGLTNLAWLDLSYNQLSGTIPPALGGLTSVWAFYLEGNQLGGAIPSALGGLPLLTELYLHGNELSGEIPSVLGDVPFLRELLLSDNELTGSIPSSLGNLASLEDLELDGNQLSGSIPVELGSLPQLVTLSLYDNQLSGSIPAALCGFKRTINPQQGGVNLPGCADSAEDRAVLIEFYNATDGPNWSTNTNWNSSAPLDQWHGVTTDKRGRVDSLYLFGNQLSGSIPSSLGSLANLKYLELSSNELSGSIPSSLGSLANLERLDLSYNFELTGSIPSSLGGLANLVSLDLWTTQLTGSIPSSLGSLANLQYLDLSFNQLTGSIPSSLGSLANLRTLRLAQNQLTGSIPAALCRFESSINPQQGGDLPCAASGAVGGLDVRLVPGDGRLTVNWEARGAAGAETAEDHDVRYRVDAEAGGWTEMAATATGATIRGLTNGTAYLVQVRAAGGAWSAAVTGTPAPDAERLSFGDARIEDQRFRQYAAIAPLVLPAATGGAGAVTYALSPAPPAGLAFDAASRTLSGAPSVPSAPTSHTYTATDADGATASLTFAIEVEVSAEEAALRRDALAAQGRALLSSVTGVIGERLRPRSGRPAGGSAGRGSAAGLGEMLASLLGLGRGGGFGAFGAGYGPGRGPAGLPAGLAGGLGASSAPGAVAGGLAAAGSAGGGGVGGLPGVGSAAGVGGVPGFGARGGAPGLAALGSVGGAGALSPVGPGGRLGGPGGPGLFGGAGGGYGLAGAGAMGGVAPFGSVGPGGAAPVPGLGLSGLGAAGWDGLLWGRSFEAALPGQEGDEASRYTVWGAGDVQSFSGSPEAGRYSGDMRSLYVGADGRLGADWLAGAAVGRSWGSADYTAAVDGAVPGRLTTLLTSVYPYVRGALSPGLEVWAVGGYGRGSAADARAGELPGAPGDLTMTMGAAGLRRDVAEAGGVALAVVGGAGALSLSSSGGGLTVSGLGAGVHQGRAALEASRASGAVSPFVQVGGRYDGGDGETGAGLEFVGGVRASTSRIDLEARGRWLSVHTASGYSEYGAMARLGVKSRADGTGLRAALSPRWGMADELSLDAGGPLGDGVSRLGRGGMLAVSGRSLSLDGEVGYGWRARRLGGIVSPLTSYRRTGFGGDLTQVGLSYQSSEELRGDVRMQFTLGREQWLDQGAGYQFALAVLSVF